MLGIKILDIKFKIMIVLTVNDHSLELLVFILIFIILKSVLKVLSDQLKKNTRLKYLI